MDSFKQNGNSKPTKGENNVSLPPLGPMKKRQDSGGASQHPTLKRNGSGMDNSFSSQPQQINSNQIPSGGFGTNSGSSHSVNASLTTPSSAGDSFNRYFSNMMSGKAQRVVDGVMEKYEQFKGIIEKQINPNKHGLSEEEISKLTVSLADFDDYKSRISLEFKAYQDWKKQSGSFEDNLQDMHLNKNLASCYRRVPPAFFKELENEEEQAQFPLLKEAGKKLSAIREYQNQLVEYLDEVELNLFYQVYFRFNQILEMILDFDKMGKKVEENLLKVKDVKEMNQKLKSNLCAGGNQIVSKRKSQQRLSNVYNLLLKLKEYNQNKDLLLQEDTKVAGILNLPSGPQTLARLSELSLFRSIKKKYVTVSQLKERDYYADFLEESGKYLGCSLFFTEQNKNKNNQVEHSMDISSIHSYSSALHGDSWIKLDDDEDEIDECLQVFEWQCKDPSTTNTVESAELEIAALYIRSSHNYDMMRFEVFKNNLIKDAVKFQVAIRAAFRDYANRLYISNNKQPIYQSNNNKESADGFEFLNGVNDILLMKFACFYSDLIRSFSSRCLSLLNTIKQEAIRAAYANNSSIEFWETKMTPILCAYTSLQLELMDSFTDDLLSYVKYTDTSTDANIQMKLSMSNKVFSYWIESYPGLMKQSSELDFSKAAELSAEIVTKIKVANSHRLDQFDSQFFFLQKSELHFELFSTFHKKQLAILEQALLTDNWVPFTLSYKIYSLLDYFFKDRGDGQVGNSEEDEQEEEVEEFNKVRNKIIKDDSDEENEEEEEDLQDLNHYYMKKTERDYKIQLNRVVFEKEGTKYGLTECFIVLIRQLQKYFHLMADSHIAFSSEYATRVVEIIRYYNSYSREFLVLAKGVKQPQMNNKVTVKNLATSTLNLAFLLKLLPKITSKLIAFSEVDEQFCQIEVETKLYQEIKSHSDEIFTTIPNIIKDALQKASLQVGLLGWHKPQEKINVPLVQTARILDQIRSLHAVLEELLNSKELRNTFDAILQDLTEIYVKTFQQLLKSPDANRLSQQRIKEEITYLATETLEIQVIGYLPSTLDFAAALEQIISLETLPKLVQIKNKLILGNDIEDDGNQANKQDKLEQEILRKGIQNDEIDKIAKKFSQKQDILPSNSNNDKKEQQQSENSILNVVQAATTAITTPPGTNTEIKVQQQDQEQSVKNDINITPQAAENITLSSSQKATVNGQNLNSTQDTTFNSSKEQPENNSEEETTPAKQESKQDQTSSQQQQLRQEESTN